MTPVISSSAVNSMFDTVVDIWVDGLKPNQSVTLHSSAMIDNGNIFECIANYIANSDGHVNLKKYASVGGCYRGVEPMGLFWAMEPSTLNKSAYARMAKIDVNTPLVVTVRLYDGIIDSLKQLDDLRQDNRLKNRVLDSTNLNRWLMAPGTERIVLYVDEHNVCGTLFIPSGKGLFPGVIVMFGGYPGTMEYKAALLASHGFAALALAFTGMPGLPEFSPCPELRLEYFERAVNYMLNHEKIDSRRGVGIVSLSQSSSIALAMAENLSGINCVISVSGYIFSMFGQLTYKNKSYRELLFSQSISFPQVSEILQGNATLYHGRNIYLVHSNPLHSDFNGSRIKFYEKSNVAFMFVAGLSDEALPAEYYANQAEKLLKLAKHPNYKILRYPGAGHLIEPCYGIHHFITAQKLFDVYSLWGGKTIPHCRAQKDAWFQQIEFLKFNLCTKKQSLL